MKTVKSGVRREAKWNYNPFLTLQEAASGMHPKWQGGGQILPAPIKTSLEAILTQFWLGDKNNRGNFFLHRFLAQKMPFLRTFSLNGNSAGYTSEIWKIDKSQSKCAKKCW